MNSSSGLVVQPNASLPSGEGVTERAVALRQSRIGGGEQPWRPVGPGLGDVSLLGVDGVGCGGRQGHQLLGSEVPLVDHVVTP